MIDHPKILYLFSAPLVAHDGSPLEPLDMKGERDAIIRELSTCQKAVTLRIGYATIDAPCVICFRLPGGIQDIVIMFRPLHGTGGKSCTKFNSLDGRDGKYDMA